MNAENWLYYHLSTDATVSALLGSKIFPTLPTQDTALPCLTYTRLGTEPVHHLGGISSLSSTTLQLDWWAEDYQQLLEIGNACRESLDGFRGEENGVNVLGCFWQDQQEQQEETRYHGTQLFLVWTS